jgi:hypothetical protein
MRWSRWRRDPGECPVCGAAHTACTAAGSGKSGERTVVVQQLGNHPATRVAVTQPSASADDAPLKAEVIQATLPPGQFTTATYRGSKKGGPRK